MQNPGILYSVIANGNVILCEYKNENNPYNLFQVTQVAQNILTRIDPACETRKSFSTQEKDPKARQHFHIHVSKGLTFLCMSEFAYPTRRAHLFLEALKPLFLSHAANWRTSSSHAYQDTFIRQLQKLAIDFSDPSTDKMEQLQNLISDTMDTTLETLDLVLERGERIESLQDKISNLYTNSVTFKTTARRMKMRFCWKNIKLTLVIVGLVVVILFLIVWFACGVPDFKICTGGNHPPPPKG